MHQSEDLLLFFNFDIITNLRVLNSIAMLKLKADGMVSCCVIAAGR